MLVISQRCIGWTPVLNLQTVPSQGLGKLADKFPFYAKSSVDCLREFLTNPSKILTRLHRQHLHDLEKNPPQVLVTKSDRFVVHLCSFFIGSKRDKNGTTHENTSDERFSIMRTATAIHSCLRPFRFVSEKWRFWPLAIQVLVTNMQIFVASKIRLQSTFVSSHAQDRQIHYEPFSTGSIRNDVDGRASYISASLSSFEKLRDAAISNLCKSLKAQLTEDRNCIPALVSAITTRLFHPDAQKNKNWSVALTLHVEIRQTEIQNLKTKRR